MVMPYDHARRRAVAIVWTALAATGATAIGCTKSPPQAAHDANQDASVEPKAALAPPSKAEEAPAAPASPRDRLADYLRAHAPSGAEVVVDRDESAPVRVVHTVTSSDTHASIAAAYLELTEIYAARDLEAALRKKYPWLKGGAKIDVPSVLTEPVGDPQEERLGWPEDKSLRAVFSTGGFAQQHWEELLGKLAARGLNAVILDAKDYMGPVNYPTKAKIAVETGAAAKAPIPNLARMIRFAHRRGIRVSLRIPCFHDPWTDKKLEGGRLSMLYKTGDRHIHIDWLDPTNTEAQDYAIELAKEGVEAGADEINLDYVRFPVHIGPSVAVLPAPKERSKIIRDFVRRVHAVTKPAGAMLSLDLFGVTATGDRGDIEKLGQDIGTVGPEAEAIMPMVYPSHYDKGYHGWEFPGDHPEIVGIGTKAAVAQLKRAKAETVVRSWLQAFAWRTNVYGSKYVVAQAKSAETNGGAGWAMWSPSCEYAAVWNGFPPKNVAKEPEAVASNAASQGAAAAKTQAPTAAKTSPETATKTGAAKHGGVAAE